MFDNVSGLAVIIIAALGFIAIIAILASFLLHPQKSSKNGEGTSHSRLSSAEMGERPASSKAEPQQSNRLGESQPQSALDKSSTIMSGALDAKTTTIIRAATFQVCSDSDYSKDPELSVEKFQCMDDVIVGKHHKKWNWILGCHESKHEWFLKVDEGVGGGNTLQLMVDGKEIFKNKFQQDFMHQWSVRGSLRVNDDYDAKVLSAKVRGEALPCALEAGVDNTEKRPNYEVKGANQLRGQDQWYPAILVGCNSDGSYETEVFIPEDNGKHRKLPDC
eukprot:gnl/MRDRNA2_/MRDRNA2_84670_c0_seq4.p2 gnl/MRDRNA2_/MRDRNA2_84670_c0~~gnl/MRDRNA2_/MRDRNA2_84670_c0_seq4.p2  ORF type:complete len:276 (+),score=60.13 gnl/MRDRNA2_/MRDRNA2_84670_c0_seq4:102-929(+)